LCENSAACVRFCKQPEKYVHKAAWLRSDMGIVDEVKSDTLPVSGYECCWAIALLWAGVSIGAEPDGTKLYYWEV